MKSATLPLSLLLPLLTVILLLSCNSKGGNINQIEFTEPDEKVHSELTFICNLNENLGFLESQLKDIAFLTDTTFVIANDKKAYIYNTHGDQIKVVGNNGRGPGEYVSASLLYVSDKYIYIWCSMTLKLLVYDKNGDLVDDYSGFNSACSRFVVLNDEVVYFYGLGSGDKLIRSYDLKTKTFANSFDTPQITNQILFMHPNSGGVCTDGDKVLYSHPSELTTKSITDNKSAEIFTINDPKFKVEPIPNISIVQNYSHQERYEYLQNNSMMTAIHSYNDTTYIMAETGVVVFEQSDNTPDLSKRDLVIYTVDNDNKPIKKTAYHYPLNTMLYKFYKGGLYSLTINEELSGYTLNKVQ